MSDLISRELLVKEIVNRPTEQSGYNPVYINGCATRQNEIIDIINDMPTVEAVPVVHGEWRHIGGDEWGCTSCGHVISTEGSWEKPTAKFCEECGCDMRTSAE